MFKKTFVAQILDGERKNNLIRRKGLKYPLCFIRRRREKERKRGGERERERENERKIVKNKREREKERGREECVCVGGCVRERERGRERERCMSESEWAYQEFVQSIDCSKKEKENGENCCLCS